MEFEWDPAKAALNAAKHGVPFDYAARVFGDPRLIDRIDRRKDYGEERRLVLGEVDGRLLFVSYTLRFGVVRLISARKANPRERRQYDDSLHA